MLGEKALEKRNICGFIIEIFEYGLDGGGRKMRSAKLLKIIKSAR
jgi:hypothetical protein